MKLVLSILTMGTLYAFTACSQNANQGNNAIIANVDSLNYKKENCDLANKIKQNPENYPDFNFFDTICSSIEVSTLKYTFESSAITQKINAKLQKELLSDFGMNETPYPSMEALINSVDEEDSGFNATIGMETVTNKNKVLTVQIWQEYYGHGAAHPMYYSNYYTFNTASGDLIKLEDLFQDNTIPHVTLIGRKQFIKENGADGWDFTNGSGDFFLSKNFKFDDKGLTFFYNLYEIGPYVMGAPSFTIKYSDLKNLIKPGSLIEAFIN
ncbi:MAG TPA: RsiV family protein [Taishania sp.]|nr:RsiV family protein [Taishania sp.]